jgi:hypothetical protein
VFVSKRSVVLSLAPLLCAVYAFPQAGIAAIDHSNQPGGATVLRAAAVDDAAPATEVSTENVPGAPSGVVAVCTQPALPEGSCSAPEHLPHSSDDSPATSGNKPGNDSKIQLLDQQFRVSEPAEFNRDIYYRNKLEFSLDGGWLPINIPFPLDVFVGDNYNTYPLKYTLVPVFASLRWQIDGIEGPWVLRGNWDMTLTGSITAIPRGPESHFLSYIMGIRRNFVPRRGPVAPYFDVRLGFGDIDAKGPDGVKYAQGQNLTFTVNMGSGVRYNFNSRYAISAGMNFMHISNLDLSESNGKPNWGVRNYGINVYGPMVGIDVRLGGHSRSSVQ